LAIRAALRFAELDIAALWRRLISIACEDVGAADIEKLVETIAVATSPRWRSQHDEKAILAGVVRRLAEAPKDRSADLAMLAVRNHDSLGATREICRQATLDRRLQLITDPHASLLDRAVATWFSSGLDFRYERIVGQGDLGRLGEIYRALGISDELSEAAITAGRRTREPFTILVPLVWLEIQRSGGGVIVASPIQESPVVDGMLLCAIDEHTRTGKQAINRLIAEDAGLRRRLSQFVPKSRWSTAAQHAAFYVDGAAVTPRFEWMQSSYLEQLGIESDLGSAKVPREGVRPLLETMQQCLGRLNEIRRDVWLGLPSKPEPQREFSFGAE